jgi:hypothetical protein
MNGRRHIGRCSFDFNHRQTDPRQFGAAAAAAVAVAAVDWLDKPRSKSLERRDLPTGPPTTKRATAAPRAAAAADAAAADTVTVTTDHTHTTVVAKILTLLAMRVHRLSSVLGPTGAASLPWGLLHRQGARHDRPICSRRATPPRCPTVHRSQSPTAIDKLDPGSDAPANNERFRLCLVKAVTNTDGLRAITRVTAARRVAHFSVAVIVPPPEAPSVAAVEPSGIASSRRPAAATFVQTVH